MAVAVHYKLKAIKFLGRDVPIVVQNENGPCPLIALANVLLLRNQIQLSVDCPEVSQERLMALIAGFLLDSNNPDRLGTSNAEVQANLQKNVGDAVEMLPKLTTGLDVNILYHDIKGFEVWAFQDRRSFNPVVAWDWTLPLCPAQGLLQVCNCNLSVFNLLLPYAAVHGCGSHIRSHGHPARAWMAGGPPGLSFPSHLTLCLP